MIEEYYKNFDTFDKKAVFIFDIEMGGIGDFLKFFSYALLYCMNNKIKMYYLLNNNPLIKYIKLKFNKFYITQNKIVNRKNIHSLNDLDNISKHDITNNIFYIIRPNNMYNNFDIYEKINFVNEIFDFTDEIKKTQMKLTENLKNYISIHLRLGDKFLETDKSFMLCPNDIREYNESNIFTFIEQNRDKNIIFFCDNKSYKNKIKEKYNFINITDLEVGHTSFRNTRDSQIFGSVTEFYILTKSTEIYVASNSGFSMVASKFNNVPLYNI
jgi:hypothetical protein